MAYAVLSILAQCSTGTSFANQRNWCHAALEWVLYRIVVHVDRGRSFCHSRLSSVEHSGEIARPTVIRAPAASAPQAALLSCPTFQGFFGGARGGLPYRSSGHIILYIPNR
jgi:hypothetical protein